MTNIFLWSFWATLNNQNNHKKKHHLIHHLNSGIKLYIARRSALVLALGDQTLEAVLEIDDAVIAEDDGVDAIINHLSRLKGLPLL